MANAKKKCDCGNQGAYAIFKINAAGAAWGSIIGDINLQEDLMALMERYYKEGFNPETLIPSGNVRIEEKPDGKYDINTGTYEFEQGEASDVWVIEHNLNKFPTVVCVDSAGRQFYGEVVYDSLNQITVLVNGATKGKAYLN